MSGSGGLEIERTFLLRGMPLFPAPVELVEIEQGYLPGGGLIEGRLRRSRDADGREMHFHTVKSGLGLVRQETEKRIDPVLFDQQWPRTCGRRLRKTRHRIKVDGLTWEVDRFHDLPDIEGRPLIMAEVEIPESIDPAGIPIPRWIAEQVVREVTEEPRFRNYALAIASATI